MTCKNIQIVEAYKQGLTPDEIAQALGYSVQEVLAILQFDNEVRREVEKHNSKLEGEFVGMEELALRTLKSLMTDADKDSVRMAASAYVLDQRLGLKQPRHNTTISVTVNDFNDRFRQVKERKQQLEKECLEVESKVISTT